MLPAKNFTKSAKRKRFPLPRFNVIAISFTTKENIIKRCRILNIRFVINYCGIAISFNDNREN